ncbi:MAG: rhomboid family intramembrane serine protease, partial [Bacteroidales bacterium]|nr:rhomboid family intramembrane serine protease [Bacteroidales bacterium]
NKTMEEAPIEYEKRKFIHSLVFPLFFLLIIWMIKLVEVTLELDFTTWGIYPLKLKGLKGILLSPLVHANFKHLMDNSVPLLVLGVAIFYFYRPVAYRVFFLTYIMVGIWVWFGGRAAYHIGASGLVYGFASFLFISGVILREIRLLAISLLVVFLYGSLVWGIFPIKKGISWESHMLGAIAGLILSFYYRKQGPQRIEYDWEEEEDDNSKDD